MRAGKAMRKLPQVYHIITSLKKEKQKNEIQVTKAASRL